MSGYRIRTIPTGVGCRVSGGNSPRKGWRNNRPGHSGRYVFWGRSRILTPIHAIAICAMLDMLASSNTWLAPATAYCREATRETVNQFAQGSGARQSKGGDRHRHQISARPYAHDSPPCGAVSFAAIVETHTSCMRISNYRHGTQRLSVCPRRQVPVTPMFRRCGVPRGLQAAPMSAVESDVTAPLS